MAFRFPATLIVCFALSCIALQSCSQSTRNNTGILTWEPETKAERNLREKAEKLQRTVGEGSLVGATLGGAVGLLAGPQGAFRGAKVGQFLGAGAGSYLSSLQADYAEREAVLEQIAADISATNRDLDDILVTMRQVLDEHQERIVDLRAEIAEGRTSERRLKRQQARARRSSEEMRNAIQAAGVHREFFGEARDLAVDRPEDAEKLDPYLKLLADRIDAMRRIAETMVKDV